MAFSIIAFTADFLLCNITWYTQPRSKIPNVAYLFSGTLMLSSIMFYYLSRFLTVLIHFIVNGEPLFISSLFLILTQGKSSSHLSALSESLNQFKWIFKTFVYFWVVHYIRLCFWIFITYRLNSRKKYSGNKSFPNILLTLLLFLNSKQHQLWNSIFYTVVQSFSHANLCRFYFRALDW